MNNTIVEMINKVQKTIKTVRKTPLFIKKNVPFPDLKKPPLRGAFYDLIISSPNFYINTSLNPFGKKANLESLNIPK